MSRSDAANLVGSSHLWVDPSGSTWKITLNEAVGDHSAGALVGIKGTAELVDDQSTDGVEAAFKKVSKRIADRLKGE